MNSQNKNRTTIVSKISEHSLNADFLKISDEIVSKPINHAFGYQQEFDLNVEISDKSSNSNRSQIDK